MLLIQLITEPGSNSDYSTFGFALYGADTSDPRELTIDGQGIGRTDRSLLNDHGARLINCSLAIPDRQSGRFVLKAGRVLAVFVRTRKGAS